MIGQSISGYSVVQEIGRGAMSEVYLAIEESLHRKVALKVLASHLCHDPELKSRFEQEAQVCARLNHPSIVSIYQVGTQGGRPFIAMEYVEGETLQQVLARHGPLHPVEATHVAECVAGALAHAHQRGIIHRDVKPANIMSACDSGRVILMDFGIARGHAHQTIAGSLLGTPAYMSPEQFDPSPFGLLAVDHRSDIYSLGILLFTLLAGRPPFSSDNPWELSRHHLATPPPSLCALRPDIPEWLDAVVSRCLQKHPSQRFQSACEVVEGLRAGRQGLPAPTPVAGLTSQAHRRKSRRSWLMGILVLVVVVLASVLTLSMLLGEGEPAPSSGGGPRDGPAPSTGGRPRSRKAPSLMATVVPVEAERQLLFGVKLPLMGQRNEPLEAVLDRAFPGARHQVEYQGAAGRFFTVRLTTSHGVKRSVVGGFIPNPGQEHLCEADKVRHVELLSGEP